MEGTASISRCSLLKALDVRSPANTANTTVSDRLPPRRSGVMSPTRRESPATHRYTSPTIEGASRPSLVSFATVVATLAFTAISFRIGGQVEMGILATGREVDFNTFGYVVGCFVSIMTLYLFLIADGKARATRRYSDWRLVNARTVVVWLTFSSWTLGALHLLFWANDLTRP